MFSIPTVKSELILACRTCLATDVNLYNIHDNCLSEPLFQVTGTQIYHTDGLPQFLCGYCRTALFQSIRFRRKSQVSQNLLVAGLLEQQVITTQFIKTLDRASYHLHCPLVVENVIKFCYNPITVEKHSIDNEECYEINTGSLNDDENFVSIIKVDTNEIKTDNSLPLDTARETLRLSPKSQNSSNELLIKAIDDISVIKPEEVSLVHQFVNVDNEEGSSVQLDYDDGTHVQTDNDISDSIDEDCTLDKIAKFRAQKGVVKKKEKKKRVKVRDKKCVEKKKKENNRSTKNKKIRKSNFETDEYWFWFEDDEKRKQFEEEFNFEVIILTKEQQLEEMEAKKLEKNYIQAPYKCEGCCRGFSEKAAHMNHMATHELNNGDVVCEICGLRFKTKQHLKSHTVSHKVKLRCNQCGYSNSKKYRAQEHFRIHQGQNHECEHCGKTFRLRSNYHTHVRTLHPAQQVSCDICGEGFCGQRGLLMHKRIHKLDQVLQKSELSRCDNCGVQFQSAEALDTHLDAFTGGGGCSLDARPCTECGENFDTEEQLNSHADKHKRQYQCGEDNCDMAFPTEESRAIHIQRIHLNVKKKENRRESNSRYYYKRRSSRERLKRGTSGREMKVMCEFCGKKFLSPAALQTHQRIHTGDRPFECSVCQKRFSCRYYMQSHLRTHTGERPYQCKLCPKAFAKRSVYTIHQRVHTGAKPYECAACGKSFTQSNSLKLHVMTVHLKQPAPYKSKKRLQKQQERMREKMET